MADATKRNYPKFTSPRLVLKFPKLNEPDYGSKDYPKPDGEYSTKGIAQASDPAIQAFIAKLNPAYQEAIAAAEKEFKALKVETRKKLGQVTVNDLFTTLYDQETEQPTGEIEFKFAMKAGGIIKKGPKTGKSWSRKPDLFDAKGLPMRACPAIWGGTVARISFEASPYFIPGSGAAGLKLGLMAVQIIDLVSAGQRTASSHGFEQEDGYEHDDGAFKEETGGEEAPGLPEQTGSDQNDSDF